MVLSLSFRRLSMAAATLALVLPFFASAEVPSPRAPTLAQQTTIPALVAAKPAESVQTVTIFGHRRAELTAGITRIDPTKASSCNFMTGSDIYLGGRTGMEINRGVVGDAYNRGSGAFADNSPYGNAAGTGGYIGEGCTNADIGFAAGRSYIARHDHSMDDAFAAFDAKDYPKALILFHKSYTKMGYPEAAFMVAKMYLYGVGATRNTAQAIVWLHKIGDFEMYPFSQPLHYKADAPDAMDIKEDTAMTLGKIYLTGWDGIAKNPKEARRWFVKADNLGFAPATHLLGLMSETGYACDKNMAKAVAYFERAGNAGYAQSQYELGVIFYDGADGVAQDKVNAGVWLLQAAKQGHPDALYIVGRMYDLGEGGAKADPQKALTYYKMAASKDQSDAQYTLGISYYSGDSVAKDPVMARKLFEASAKQGVLDAMFDLAVMQAKGEGGDKDMAQAYVWFKLAGRNGLDKADVAAAEIAPKLTADERVKADSLLTGKTG